MNALCQWYHYLPFHWYTLRCWRPVMPLTRHEAYPVTLRLYRPPLFVPFPKFDSPEKLLCCYSDTQQNVLMSQLGYQAHVRALCSVYLILSATVTRTDNSLFLEECMTIVGVEARPHGPNLLGGGGEILV